MMPAVNPFENPTPLQPYRKAIVIGASRGIGEAIAKKLAQQGYLVAAVSLSLEKAQAVCDEINHISGKNVAKAYAHDTRDTGEVPGLLNQIMAELGGLDLLVYNAGVLLPTTLTTYQFENDLGMMQVNVIGAMAWMNAVAPLFQELGQGQIVGISSVAGDRGRVKNPAYTASKAALTTYLEALRNRLTRYGVNVLTIKPGFVDTAMTKGQTKLFWLISPDKAAEDIWKAIRNRKQVVYTPFQWRYLMLLIQHIPSFIFRRLSF